MFNLSRSKQPLLALTFTVIIALAASQNTTTTVAPPTTTSTTTTPAPNTTTTTTPPPTTTTIKPPTPPVPPTPPPTTPAPPTPPPKPEIINGSVTDGDHTCIRYQFSSINIMMEYPLEGSNKTGVSNISMPMDAHLDAPKGTCSSSNQTFSLISEDVKANHSVKITFRFASNSNSVVLDFLEVTAMFNDVDFKNVSHDHLGNSTTQHLDGASLSPNFNVEKTHSYSCGHVTIPKTDAGPFHVAFKGLRIQAFMEKDKNGQFSSEHNCQSEINDVVPIAVGLALTGLVIIVMIAYFIGRRRSRRLTYQSV